MTTMPASMVSQMLDSTLEDLNGLIEPLLHSHHMDEVVSSTAKRLWQEIGEKDLPATLFAEGASLTIMGTLLRLSKSRVDDRPFALTDTEVKRLVDAIDDHLHTSISLGTLAEEIGWRRRHLGRAFKAKLGRSPYQYVLDRRVARALELLETHDMPISEVAYACGFSSQQHMTSVFTKRLGVSPAKYRRLKRR